MALARARSSTRAVLRRAVPCFAVLRSSVLSGGQSRPSPNAVTRAHRRCTHGILLSVHVPYDMNVARTVRTHGTSRKYDQANLIAHGVDGARLLTMGEAEFRAVAGAGVLRRRSIS